MRLPPIETHPEVNRLLGAQQAELLRRRREQPRPSQLARDFRDQDPLAEAWRASQELLVPARTWLGRLARWPGRARRQRQALGLLVDALLGFEERNQNLAVRLDEAIEARFARSKRDLEAFAGAVAERESAREQGLDQRLAARDRLFEERLDDALAGPLDPLLEAASRRRKRLAEAHGRLLPRREFDESVRGSQAMLRDRLGALVQFFAAATGPVLDAGCGRGAFLDVLAEAGIDAIGVDLEEGVLVPCRVRGRSVVCDDGLAWLAARVPGSLGGVFAAQFVEHLEPLELSAFLEVSARAIAPGGRILIETLHPESWLSLARWFWRDPTHVRLVHPDTLAAMLEAAGFGAIEVHTHPPLADVPAFSLGRAEDLDKAGSAALAMAELRDALFRGPDFFVVATR